MEEKVLFNVLNAISKGGTGIPEAPDQQYLDALETIGYIERGWNTKLTKFGFNLLELLRGKQWSRN